MKKRLGNININISNRAFYSLVLLSISILAVAGVFAFGTQNPGTFGHSVKELDFSGGIDGDVVFNGNVNVSGGLKLGTTSSCGSGSEGSLRYNSGSKKVEFCNATSWSQVTGAAASGLPFFGTAHTKEQCQSADGTVADFQENSFCRFQSSSCPSGWTRYYVLGSTSPNSCSSGCAGPCTTGSHYFTNKSTETCQYVDGVLVQYPPHEDQPGGVRCEAQTTLFTCTANLVEVGCY